MEEPDTQQDLPPLGKKIDRDILDEKNFQVILNQAKDENLSYQTRAVESLGRIGDTRATAALLELLKTADPDVQYVVTGSLAKLRDPLAVGDLILALRSENHWVRRGAARALGEIGDKRAQEPLIARLADRKDAVRKEAALAIGKVGDDTTISALEEFIRTEDDPEVRSAARLAIKRIQGE